MNFYKKLEKRNSSPREELIRRQLDVLIFVQADRRENANNGKTINGKSDPDHQLMIFCLL
ncbi:hypothetical protein T4B_14204 [Trichinella pseudospiralis]|uniref:Uncharacterized protein n=1 Tax=Trichinella pseudospiralis TaxID=6337 RepID=A0A0V1IZ93_TRIPS|nr:hypothetical protein T4B_14204 [Trichinella pseudospiralis]